MADNIVVAGGSGRSGSTLIAEVLAAATGRAMLGEVSQFWSTLSAGTPCACGEILRNCEFWSRVLEEIPSMKDADVEAVRSEHRRLVHASTRPHRRRPDASTWVSAHTALIAAAQQLSPNGYVDSSKQLTHLKLLADRFKTTTAFVHLTRDPRAVAFSWANSKPILREQGREMRTMHPAKSSVMWVVRNRPQRLLAPEFVSSTHFRYEQFCDEPATFVREVLTALDDERATDPSTLDALAAARFTPNPPVHALAGNPAREGSPETVIRPDNRWIAQQSSSLSRLVWILTAFENRHYRAIRTEQVGRSG